MELDTLLYIVGTLALAAALLGGLTHKTLVWRTALVVAALTYCGGALYPPQEKLKAGPDLAGGTSLLYEIDTAGASNPNQAIRDTIAVLKRRVDPQGVRNLIWRQEGGNRLEIQMPRPSEAVQQRRERLTEIEDAIQADNIDPAQLQAVINLDEDAFDQAAAELAGDVEGRMALLEDLKQAWDTYQRVLAEYEGLEGDARIDFVGRVTEARRAYEQARAEVLATNLELEELRAVLNRSDSPEEEGEPSPREQGLAELTESHPQRVEQIDRYIERYEAYNQVKGQLDDAQDLIRLLQGSGVLEFRIPVQPNEVADLQRLRRELSEEGPGAAGTQYKWIQLGDIAEFAQDPEQRAALRSNPAGYFDGRGMIAGTYGEDIYLLMWDTLERSITKRPQQEGWTVTGVSETMDERMLPAVRFELNPRGARHMSRLTGEHIGRPMAVILDGRVMTAPTIQGQLSDRVTITNESGFSRSEIDYLRRTLAAGSLQAQLSPEPISIRTLGPSLGEDNLRQGLEAARDALIIVGIFMMFYYFFAGAVADLALLGNVVIILGIMSLYEAAFTLPGIAGIVLTIGMCVDANVLVFERIREEQNKGADLPTAIRLGYGKALSAIIDGNLTNLIVCVILYQTATVEVRGFAVTLGIGILATLFTSLFMTRTIFMLWHQWFGMKDLNMLPRAAPAIDRFLTPGISWIRKRALFFTLSGAVLVASVFLCFFGEKGGVNLLDIEFRAGTEVAFKLKEGETLTLPEVRQRKDQMADLATTPPSEFDGEQREKAERIQKRIESRRQVLIDQRVERIEARGDEPDREAIKAEVHELTDMSDLRQGAVRTVGEAAGRDEASGNTRYTGFSLISTVKDSNVVGEAVRIMFAEVLDTQPTLTFAGMSADSYREAPVRAVGGVQGWAPPPGVEVPLDEFRGGVAITVDKVEPAITLEQFEDRLEAMRSQPDFASDTPRRRQVVPLRASVDAPDRYTQFVVLVADPRISALDPDTRTRWEEMARDEWELVREALDRETSLEKVSSFTPTVAQTLRDRAIVAVLLSFAAIIAYIWFRFGSLRYGLAATAAIAHDTIVALGFFALAQYLAATAIGEALLIQPFKINLGVIAALLTLIGYSLNDTIVVFDRIRENRGRLAYASPAIIDKSINQTISRTLLTSGTTLLAVIMLYIFGGDGIRGFAFTLFVGVLVGTYSSIAIASQLLAVGLSEEDLKKVQPEPEEPAAAPTDEPTV